MCQSEMNLIDNNDNQDVYHSSITTLPMYNSNNNTVNTNGNTNNSSINGVAAKIHRIKHRNSQMLIKSNYGCSSNEMITNDMDNFRHNNSSGKFQ